MKVDHDSARVRIPPPFLLLASIAVGVGLHFLFPLRFVPESVRWPLGGALLSFGVAIILSCAWMFRKAQTAIEPWKTTSHILTTGPYRWSRNPIYLSFIFVSLGIAILLDNLWIVAMQVPLIVAITKLVIHREERYLEEKFGDTYRGYKNQVKRWL